MIPSRAAGTFTVAGMTFATAAATFTTAGLTRARAAMTFTTAGVILAKAGMTPTMAGVIFATAAVTPAMAGMAPAKESLLIPSTDFNAPVAAPWLNCLFFSLLSQKQPLSLLRNPNPTLKTLHFHARLHPCRR
jgi:hypothetical protein